MRRNRESQGQAVAGGTRPNPRRELAAEAGQNIDAKTIYRMETGERVKLETVRAVAGALGVGDPEFGEWIAAWVKWQLGRDAKRVSVRGKDPSELAKEETSHTHRLMAAYENLKSRKLKNTLIRLAECPGVLKKVPYLFDLAENGLPQSGGKRLSEIVEVYPDPQ